MIIFANELPDRWYPDRESNKAYLIKSVKMPQKDKFAEAPIDQGVVN